MFLPSPVLCMRRRLLSRRPPSSRSAGAPVPARFRPSVGRVRMDNVSLRKLTLWAYGIPDDRAYALIGPDWLGTESFIIEATFPASNSPDQVRMMARTLLADRFKLALRRETRELPFYALIVDKNGPKIQAVEPGQGGTNSSPGKLQATKTTMPHFADLIARYTGHQVVDDTGLKGVYTFTLEWTPDEVAAGGDAGPSLLAALREQLGVRLEARKGPVEVLVVDHMDRVPTEN